MLKKLLVKERALEMLGAVLSLVAGTAGMIAIDLMFISPRAPIAFQYLLQLLAFVGNHPLVNPIDLIY